MKQYTGRKLILLTAIILNTCLIAVNLIYVGDSTAAFSCFLSCCVCWFGVYLINWSERLELNEKEKKETGERNHDDE